MKSVYTVCTIALSLVVALVVGCAPGGGPTTTAPIKIGLLLPYTGFVATYGPLNEDAVTLLLDEIGWEIAGRKVEIIKEDTACDPAVAMDKVKKLVERDKVDVIIGPQLSSCALAVAKYTAASRTVCLIPDAIPYSLLLQGGENVFMGMSTGDCHRMAQYAYEELGFRTATVMHDDFEAGYDFAQGFIDTFEKLGGKVIQRQKTPMGETDFAPYVTALQQADCFVFWNAAPMALMRQYRASGVKMPVVAAHGTPLGDLFLAAMGDDSLGIITATSYTSEIDTPSNRKHVEAYLEKYGRYPESLEATSTYCNLAMYVEAVKKTKGDTTPDKVITAMHELKDVETPCGPFSYNKDGCPIQPSYIARVIKKGDRYCLEILKEYPWWAPEAE